MNNLPLCFQAAIFSYSDSFRSTHRFDGLRCFFDMLVHETRERYLSFVVPGMAQLALDLPNLITQVLFCRKHDILLLIFLFFSHCAFFVNSVKVPSR